MFADARHALRQLARSPAFAVAAILTLTLAIGATTTIVAVADAVFLRPLPYPNADRLVNVHDELSKIGVQLPGVSYETFQAYRNIPAFDATAIFTEGDRNLIVTGHSQRISVLSFSPGLVEMLGAGTAYGRGFGEQDWKPEHNQVAILSYSFFVTNFGANPDLLGKSIRLDQRLYTVVGVMRPSFEFNFGANNVDVWVPFPNIRDPKVWEFRMLARLRPGVGLTAAQSSLTIAAKRVEERVRPYRGPNGEDGGYRVRLIPLRAELLGDFRTGTLILLAAVALLFLIACVNVANLLLSRAASREKEFAIRRVLGASRWRLMRQWTTESAILAAFGGAFGLLLVPWGILLIRTLSPEQLPRAIHLDLDLRLLLFISGISALVCVLLSLASGLATTPTNESLRGPRQKTKGASILITSEVATALILLISGGLLAKSFGRLRQIDPGIRTDHILTMRIDLSGPRYQHPSERVRFFTELQNRAIRQPKVISFGAVDRLPVFTVGVDTTSGNPFSTDIQTWNPDARLKQIAHTSTADVGYFATMGIPLLSGREFSPSDTLESPRVAVINKTLAARFFPNINPIGRHILLGAPTPGASWLTIIGIIGDVRTGALDLPPMPQFYIPETQDANDRMFVVLRTQGDPLAMARALTGVIHQLDSEQPVDKVSTMDQHVSETLGEPRFRSLLVTFFACTSLLLTAVGIYGVVAHVAVQRTKEIGIRMALGADGLQVVSTVVAEGLKPIAAGAAIGICAAAILTQFLSRVLYKVSAADPATFAGALALLVIIGIAACLLPALHASRLDPLIALREE